MKANALTVKRPFAAAFGVYAGKRRTRRYELDQAATIFPSTLSRNQHHIYNLSAELTEPVDKATLEQALARTCGRFPTIAACLRAGLCRYHLEPLAHAPAIREGLTGCLQPMSRRELSQSCLRVSLEGATVSLDFFHALTDGSGALVFLKTLLAEYVRLRYGAFVPSVGGVCSGMEPPRAGEAEDSYARYARACGTEDAAEKPLRAYKHLGESDGQPRCTRLTMDAAQVHSKAREKGATITEYLAALMLQAMEQVKARDASPRRDRPVLLTLPVNLRSHFPSQSLRNFSLCCTVIGTPGQGISEACADVRRQLAEKNTAQGLACVMRGNDRLLRIARYALPLLPMKNAALRIGYRMIGSNRSTLSMSNLGRVALPEELAAHVRDLACRADTNAYDAHHCTVMTYRDVLSMQFSRSVTDDVLERRFIALLTGEGIAWEAAMS